MLLVSCAGPVSKAPEPGKETQTAGPGANPQSSTSVSHSPLSDRKPQPLPKLWSTGFWFWEGSNAKPPAESTPVDVVFFQAGTMDVDNFGQWHAYGKLPGGLPEAKEYWLVMRSERQDVPDGGVIPRLVQTISDVTTEARRKNLNLVGVQLDIDSPTGSLDAYAHFLFDLRKALPPGIQISITALLDWFREGTDIAFVLNEADEFVPQFYDLADPRSREGAIAAKIDATRWAPIFNRFERRYRIGISTFGRARALPYEKDTQSTYVSVFSDLTPLQVARNPNFKMATRTSAAGEVVLTYRASKATRIGYNDFTAGSGFEFILPTPEVVQSAVRSSKQFGGYAAGVVFFRWPAMGESLALQPRDVLELVQLKAQVSPHPETETMDGSCAAVSCVDVFLNGTPPLSPRSARYRIHISGDLEYFLPASEAPVRLIGRRELEVALPPYCACGALTLGRAVSNEPVRFTVAEMP
jgi:hypothetical protein